jgi:sec-independent protein translocase protein TatA
LFLFIFESIGTSELILVGIVALIFLGPRKLPELVRKFGKIMGEFRGTANEFKETWQREVNLEEEAKAFDINALEAETVSRLNNTTAPAEPTIKEIDPASFEHIIETDEQGHRTQREEQPNLPLDSNDPIEKKI